MMLAAFITTFLLFISTNLYATSQTDSLCLDSASSLQPHLSLSTTPSLLEKQKKDERPIMEFSYVPVPLIITSFIVKSQKENFRGARNNFIPKFQNELDNYIQYSPFILTLALKTAGVENRNQWGRMLASSALSYAAMAALVNAAKYTIKEQRPDGSSRNSFPSGHTATAFASATILHKEYGLTRSLWYSVAGYAIATGTGVMRVMNNRHWASDILAGAGIGIFSVDLGYFLSDLMFKDRYTLRHNRPDVNNFYSSPSFFNLNIGFGIRKKHFDIADKHIEGGHAICAQAELAYFITQHIGAGVRLSISSPVVSYEHYNDNMGVYSLSAGTYFQFPLSSRFAVGGKVFAGRMKMSGFAFEDELTVEESHSFTYGVGVSAAYAYRNNIAWRLNADYDTGRVPINATFDGKQYSTHKQMDQITLSGSMSIMF
ncbi:MAG: phosphatase PAP2 family protein [Bacteroidaceae bacterium]|nr:phosphatase PAP2 family protein [Bacteroidaceae bacterium]